MRLMKQEVGWSGIKGARPSGTEDSRADMQGWKMNHEGVVGSS